MKLMTGPWVAATVIVVGLAASTASAGSRGQKNAKGNGGGSHSMTGCLQKGTEGTMFMLTSVEGKGPKTVELVEMAAGVNLAPHVGHKVTITGTAVNAKTAAKDEGSTNKKEEKHEHHMKVDAVKMLSPTCP